MSLERQWYLYEKIRQFCSDICKDLVCLKPLAPQVETDEPTNRKEYNADSENDDEWDELKPKRRAGAAIVAVQGTTNKHAHHKSTFPYFIFIRPIQIEY